MEMQDINDILIDNEIGHYVHPEKKFLIIPLQFVDYVTALMIGIDDNFVRIGCLLSGEPSEDRKELHKRLLELNCLFGLAKLGVLPDGRITAECSIMNTFCNDEKLLLCISQLRLAIEYSITEFGALLQD